MRRFSAWARGRWRTLLLAALLLARGALPLVLRTVIERQASAALNARVQVGDVDLALWRGGVTLEDVAVWPLAEGPESKEPPLVAWRRLAVSMRWLPLLRHTVQLRSVDLDSPYVALDRLKDGGINLAALVPVSSPATAAEGGTAGQPWWFGIDRLSLRTGKVRFRDLMIGNGEPVEVRIGGVDVGQIALRPELYGAPAEMYLNVRIDEGVLRLATRFAFTDDGVQVDTELRAKQLPLHRARVYIPQVGWSDLQGHLSAVLQHHFATGKRNVVDGGIVVQGLRVMVPGLDEPALGWERLVVRLADVDLLAQHAAMSLVALHGATIAVTPQSEVPLPLLVAAKSAPAPPPPAATSPEPESKAAWSWHVGSLRVSDSHAHVHGAAAPLDVTLNADAHGLTSAEKNASVQLGVAVGEGTLTVEGTLRLTPLGFAGGLKTNRLPLPELVAASGAVVPELFQVGRLDTDLAIDAGALARPPGDVRVSGSLTLAEPWIAAPQAWEFSLGARAIEVGIDELRVPGATATPPPVRSSPIRLNLAKLTLAAPFVQVTRDEHGIVLPEFAAGKKAPPAAATPPAASVEPAGGAVAEPKVDLDVGAFRLSEGRVIVTDRTVKPFYNGGLAPLEVDIQKLQWPELAFARAHIQATTGEKGKLDIDGYLGPSGGKMQVNGKDIALEPFNPYATAYSPYSISSGRLAITGQVTFVKGGYDSTTSLTLHRLDLAGQEGDSLFQQQFGVPLSVALALMRDLQGNISLDVPVQSDEQGTKVDLFAIVGGALRHALVNALTSPLKLVGAVLPGGEGQPVGPVPVVFRAGRDVLAPEGEQGLSQLAALLASRPGLGVILLAAPSTQDVRWLREQALAAELSSQGVLGALRGLSQRAARGRITAALAARARDEVGALEPDDAKILDEWLAERPALDAAQLRTLAEARLARVVTTLRDHYGLGPERVSQRDPVPEPSEGSPAVRFEFGPAATR